MHYSRAHACWLPFETWHETEHVASFFFFESKSNISSNNRKQKGHWSDRNQQRHGQENEFLLN